MKAAAAEVLVIGAALAGGFFAGQLKLGEDTYALIVAPKAEGASWRYLVEKATIGMTCDRKLSTEFAAELAEDLIADLAQDAEADQEFGRVWNRLKAARVAREAVK